MELVTEETAEQPPKSRQDLIDQLWEEFMAHQSAQKLTYLDEGERSYIRGVCDGLEKALNIIDPRPLGTPEPPPMDSLEIPF